MWGAIHTRLQEACIDLWPLEQDCRTLIAEAEIDARHISFAEPNALRWEKIILECHKQRSLNRLAPVLLNRYEDNPMLQLAVEPWIRGNPKESVRMTKEAATTVTDATGIVELTAPATIVVSTPSPPTSNPVATPNRAGRAETEADEPELVPVLVPREFLEKAQQALVATVDSLRKTVSQHEKDLQELIAWREQLSKLSRAEVAVSTGGNESRGEKQ